MIYISNKCTDGWMSMNISVRRSCCWCCRWVFFSVHILGAINHFANAFTADINEHVEYTTSPHHCLRYVILSKISNTSTRFYLCGSELVREVVRSCVSRRTVLRGGEQEEVCGYLDHAVIPFSANAQRNCRSHCHCHHHFSFFFFFVVARAS